ncbi:MAG: hypothetical protein ABIR56_06330 [Polaromonas sp.]
MPVGAAGLSHRLQGSNDAPYRALSWMLSHHELAKLLLISRVPGQISAASPDAAALIEKNLVALPESVLDERVLHITRHGAALLRTLESFAATQSSGQRHDAQDFCL